MSWKNHWKKYLEEFRVLLEAAAAGRNGPTTPGSAGLPNLYHQTEIHISQVLEEREDNDDREGVEDGLGDLAKLLAAMHRGPLSGYALQQFGRLWIPRT